MKLLVETKNVRVLKVFAIALLILSAIEFLLIMFYAFYSEEFPENYIVYLKIASLFSDMFLAFIVLKLIRFYYPSFQLTHKIQVRFLMFAYLAIFGLIIYISILYEFADVLLLTEPYISFVDFSEDGVVVLLFFGLIFSKIISVLYVQINGFKLIKEIRKNYRESLIETSDLL